MLLRQPLAAAMPAAVVGPPVVFVGRRDPALRCSTLRPALPRWFSSHTSYTQLGPTRHDCSTTLQQNWSWEQMQHPVPSAQPKGSLPAHSLLWPASSMHQRGHPTPAPRLASYTLRPAPSPGTARHAPTLALEVSIMSVRANLFDEGSLQAQAEPNAGARQAADSGLDCSTHRRWRWRPAPCPCG